MTVGFHLQFCCPKDVIALIMIACVDALHIDQPVCDPVCEGCTEQGFDLHVLDGAALHGKEIIALIHTAPVDDLMQLLFQDAVQPDAGAAAVAFPEGMGHIHLHILLDDLIKGGLRHPVDAFQSRSQIHDRCEPEIALGNVHGAHLPGKGVDLAEQIAVDLLQARKCPHREGIQQAGVVKLQRFGLADFFLSPGQRGLVGQVQFIFQRHSGLPA